LAKERGTKGVSVFGTPSSNYPDVSRFFGTSDTTHVILRESRSIPTCPDVSGQVGKNLHPIQKHIKRRFFVPNKSGLRMTLQKSLALGENLNIT
jgi:hypothetical protein